MTGSPVAALRRPAHDPADRRRRAPHLGQGRRHIGQGLPPAGGGGQQQDQRNRAERLHHRVRRRPRPPVVPAGPPDASPGVLATRAWDAGTTRHYRGCAGAAGLSTRRPGIAAQGLSGRSERSERPGPGLGTDHRFVDPVPVSVSGGGAGAAGAGGLGACGVYSHGVSARPSVSPGCGLGVGDGTGALRPSGVASQGVSAPVAISMVPRSRVVRSAGGIGPSGAYIHGVSAWFVETRCRGRDGGVLWPFGIC